MEHASENKPKKELMYALIGTLMFLGIVLLIGVSAYLRPAGHHVVPEVAVDAAAAEAAASDGVTAESSVSAAAAVAANTDGDETLASTPSTGNLRSDDVIVTDDMSVGGEGATDAATPANMATPDSVAPATVSSKAIEAAKTSDTTEATAQ